MGEYQQIDINLNVFLNYVKNFYERVDSEITLGKNDFWLALGHYIVMIVECTNLMKKCYDEHNYKPFSTYKEL